uniref:Myosin IXAb n=1 Tax=Sphaeramia orbicularis TaxID=375764 RepID=A0A673AH48_9TELE
MGGGGMRRRLEDQEFTVRVYPGALSEGTIYCPVSACKNTSAAEVIDVLIDRLHLDRTKVYVLAEVKEFGGEEWILNPGDCPVQRMMLWPRNALENRGGSGDDYRFLLREKNLDGSIHYGGSLQMWLRVTEERRRLVERGFLPQPAGTDPPADLCALPELTERALLDSLRSRFRQEKIYTYVGSILIVVNPFQFLPIYNPKYVKLYDNHTLGKLEPHIYAVADVAYHAMLQRRRNQCIVISGESGSGKTQSTNFLIHHLTALSQKGFASGVEQTILGAGPVLEAFGNAKTAHNNNSSRFGKFIQVNYQESGTVRGAYVEKYLLEKSRLVYQEHNERNYHVFYYLLAGASEEERKSFHLLQPEEYHYLNQMTKKSVKLHWDGFCDSEVVRIFCYWIIIQCVYVCLTNCICVCVCVCVCISVCVQAGTVRDSMAKSLYSALFDWIVFRTNHALLNNKDLEDNSKILSIGVLDIFGFEDYENNSFEQFCINFANERLQHYFNQHIFKLEQEEYRSEGITWHNIEYIDNSGCINLISKKPTALLHLLDEECNFPQASNQTLLDKFKRQHDGNSYIEFPAVMEPAFIIRHYAGKVKYSVKDFREKNTDHMRPDIVALLKSSRRAFVCGLMGIDPVATFRWAVLRAYFRALVAFREAGRQHRTCRAGEDHTQAVWDWVCVDSFSFLHHPVHQRSLEILQRCKDEKYSMNRKSPRTPLSDLHGSNALNDRPGRDGYGCNGRSSRSGRLTSTGSPALEEDGIFLNSTNSKLLERAQGILLRNKNYKNKPTLPKHLLDVKSLRYLSSVTLHDRITKSLLHLHKKKKPPSISAQFQASLNKLMETLDQSEPYFVKCIRSNAEKMPLRFNDSLVLRQLRYTGMLETVRIRQSGYSIKYMFQDFVRHFHVLLPRGTKPTKSGIREFFRRIHLMPAGYQVGHTTVFLREAERQRLQSLLHQEVLRRIVTLQRRFRAVLERKHFINMRRAAAVIQVRYTLNLLQTSDTGAAVCLQAAWRGFRERRRFLQWKHSVLVLQRSWRNHRRRQRRTQAATVIQAAWRGFTQRRRYRKTCRTVTQLQAQARGHQARIRSELTHLTRTNPLLHVEPADPDLILPEPDVPEEARPDHVDQEEDSERIRTVDDTSLKSRSKRESRRMRELEQAQFSLELLKVRTGSLDHHHRPPQRQGSPEPPTGETPGKPRDSNHNHKPDNDDEAPRATFYIPSDQSPVHESRWDSPGKSPRQRRESTSRRPVVVLISMQKESPVEEEQLLAAQILQKPSQTPIAGLEVGSDPKPPQEAGSEPAAVCSSEVDIQMVLEPNAGSSGLQEDPKPRKAQKKSSAQTVIVNMVEKNSTSVFSPPRRKLPFSKSDKDLVNQERSLIMFRDDTKSSRHREVNCPGSKKKARMSRTRPDFFTRCNSEGAVQSDDDDDEHYIPAHSCTLPSSLPPPQSRPGYHGDTKMSSHKEQKKLHKTMSSGDLVLRKTSSHDGSRMKGKMRFWSKTKHSEKKMSREKEANQNGASPPVSPDLGAPPPLPPPHRDVFRDSKENKEPSPKTRRHRSLKISSITLEPAQWQNDALHILTSAHDYRSMNDFLMKKITDLESEDGKKDTLVDVVFKKALKEFRINIFNSYSTALAMDDGKSIRYKDLYALFEHILEKTMRLEQRDWSESPVKVWVNTFKVFLDEFMTEYKPMEGTIGRAPKRERKKSRKKETDIVEEHNGHIFKSTQYSIPTYCEYCSSLIWMMDRACVCKLCRYACHRKCCSKTTTMCSKKYDLELSPRQFGVELSRLTSDERAVPHLVEKLINYIEMHGLYTEGIYRKSGSTNKIKELRQGLDTDVSSVNLDDYNIHVIASVLKQWLRDLPSPLMTFELYEEFLRAMGKQGDRREVMRGVYSVIDQLSRVHLSTLERLIFHLVRVALQEETNRMSVNALAIVFAPCVLRCPDTIDPLQSVQDISKTTACVELIINEQLRKYKARLKDISSLEFAESKAKSRLTHIRKSMSKGRVRQSGGRTPSPPLSPRAPPVTDADAAGGAEESAGAELSEQQQLAMQQEERILTEQIESLQKEKEDLTYEMLTLEPRTSDDETPESEASIGTADSSENITMETQGATSDPSGICGLCSRSSEVKSRRALRRQPDSQDSADSTSTVCSYQPTSSSSNTSGSPSPHYRFRSSSSGPLLSSCGLGAPPGGEAEGGPKTGKTRHRIRLSRSSPREPAGHRRDPEFSPAAPPQLVLYGSNEFMV